MIGPIRIALAVFIGMTGALVASEEIMRRLHRCEYPFGADEVIPKACSDLPLFEDPALNEQPLTGEAL